MTVQLQIPMPIVAVQTTVRYADGDGWIVEVRVLRSGSGWSLDGRYSGLVKDEAAQVALLTMEEFVGYRSGEQLDQD